MNNLTFDYIYFDKKLREITVGICLQISHATSNLSFVIVRNVNKTKIMVKLSSTAFLKAKWLKKTQTTFVPELKMHLLTPEDKLWHEKWEEGGQSEEPFWAIFWPGGQVLSRFLLDTQKARNKRGDFLLRKLDSSFQLQFKIQCWILDVDAVPKALPHCKAEPKFL